MPFGARQGCGFPFLRNALARTSSGAKARFAKRMASLLSEEYEKWFPEAIHCLEEGLEDSL
jgi:hypothetical protein